MYSIGTDRFENLLIGFISSKNKKESQEVINEIHSNKKYVRLIINIDNGTTDTIKKYIEQQIRVVQKLGSPRMFLIDSYIHSPFSKEDATSRTSCPEFHTCILSDQHCKYSKYGSTYFQPTHGIGDTKNSRYVFVGEAPGYLGCGRWGIPFYGDRSGYILYNALHQLNILTTEIYITNIIKCTPRDNKLGDFKKVENRLKLSCVKSLKEELKPFINKKIKIIALGKVAGDTFDRLGIKYEFVYHPAYFLRIGKPNEFKEALKEIL